MKKKLAQIFTLLILIAGSATELSAMPASELPDFSEASLSQIRLPNGMWVWFKPTDYETDQICIKVAALGGYASLPAVDRSSGELAASIGRESGLGELTGDQVSVLLYENSLDFELKIQAFTRFIEGSSKKAGLETFLSCVQKVFTKQRFTEEGYKTALTNAKTSLQKLSCDADYAYEAAFLNINSQGLKVLQPMGPEDLTKVKFDFAKDFYKRAFSDPSEFVCVIVGSFDYDHALELVNKYLATIPQASQPSYMAQSFTSTFPPGITQKEIHIPKRTDAVTCLTFPWQKTMNERKIYKMAFTCQIIEACLRRAITQKVKSSCGVHVSYEFPVYPFLENPWISIHFQSDVGQVEELKQLVLGELKRLQEQGITESEIQEIKELEAGSDVFWLRENYYWSSMLTNYFLWKWNPQWIYLGAKLTQDLSPEKINILIKAAFSLQNYSVITSKP